MVDCPAYLAFRSRPQVEPEPTSAPPQPVVGDYVCRFIGNDGHIDRKKGTRDIENEGASGYVDENTCGDKISWWTAQHTWAFRRRPQVEPESISAPPQPLVGDDVSPFIGNEGHIDRKKGIRDVENEGASGYVDENTCGDKMSWWTAQHTWRSGAGHKTSQSRPPRRRSRWSGITFPLSSVMMGTLTGKREFAISKMKVHPAMLMKTHARTKCHGWAPIDAPRSGQAPTRRGGLECGSSSYRLPISVHTAKLARPKSERR